jgi:hypothetical protein
MKKRSQHSGNVLAAFIVVLAAILVFACEGPTGPSGGAGGPYVPDPVIQAAADQAAELYEKLAFASISAGGYAFQVGLDNSAWAGETATGDVVITGITLDGETIPVTGSTLSPTLLSIPAKNLIDLETLATGDLVVSFKTVVGGVLSEEKTITVDSGDIGTDVGYLIDLQTDILAIAAVDDLEILIGVSTAISVDNSPTFTSTTMSGAVVVDDDDLTDTDVKAAVGNAGLSLDIDTNVFKITTADWTSIAPGGPENVDFDIELVNNGYNYAVTVTIAVSVDD